MRVTRCPRSFGRPAGRTKAGSSNLHLASQNAASAQRGMAELSHLQISPGGAIFATSTFPPYFNTGNNGAVQYVLSQTRRLRGLDMASRRKSPPGVKFQGIDELAHNGEFWLVRDALQFAIAQWKGVWRFSNGRDLQFEPDEYSPRES
jgi:hypothetical protein